MYLQNSKNSLLDVRINLSHHPRRTQSVAQLRTITDVLVEHRPRIASLSITSLDPEIVDEITKRMLSGGDVDYPQLRKLDTGCHLWIGRLGSSVPISELKRFHLANNFGLNRSDLLHVLANLPNLETLIVENCETDWVPTLTAVKPASLPNLTNLECLGLNNNTMTRLLQLLITPKLNSSKLWWDYGFKLWLNQVDGVMAMLRANPQLQILNLCNLETQAPHWKEIFRRGVSLRILRLRSCELEEDDLEALWEQGAQDAPIIPHLEHLVLENVLDLSTNVMRRIVASRPSLRFVELRGWYDGRVDEEDVEFVRNSVERFVLETFGGRGPRDSDGESAESGAEEWSSSGTPSEGSWLSGDEDVVIHTYGANDHCQ
ncbi:hypothetical protein FRB90_008987 [Tulasnella sp. 427]|nr:hypothetical protein FRB90_008987 [Tulasnella sp. 427]